MFSFSELASQFEQRLQDTNLFTGRPDSLYEPCRYLLSLGGKRVRPALCLMGAELFGEILPDAWHAAIAIELFHNFTLIHDDIMDKAPLRRGQVTVHERNGLTSGILCGDVMSISAYEHLAKITHQLPQVFRLFNQTAIAVCEGQQLDMDYERRSDVTVEEYIQMIALKTSVLLAASLKMGALIGGATEGNAEKLYQFGKALGIAFQLQDDYLDAFGDPAKLGKQAGGDILADKKTFLYLKAMELQPDESKHRLRSFQQSGVSGTADKVPATIQWFRDTGADTSCREAVAHYSDLAFAALEDVAVLSRRKQPLYDLAILLLDRQS